MDYSHVVNVFLYNATEFDWTFNHAWFDSGGIKVPGTWPAVVKSQTSIEIICHENDGSWAGCSGWVSYKVNGVDMFFAFSNPTSTIVDAKNKIGLGFDSSIWDSMEDQYFGKSAAWPINSMGDGHWMRSDINNCSGDASNATFIISTYHNTVELANIQVVSALALHTGLRTDGYRRYFRCDDSPTNVIGIGWSHFKGIALWGDRIIFTHSNIHGGDPACGKYIVSKQTSSSDWITAATLNTEPEGWRHCCSTQACGSFMAMGIQQEVDSDSSQIQIIDNRPVQYYQRPVVIDKIDQPKTGVNGVAMAKESGLDGKYIVAGINGHSIMCYRSQSADLFHNPGWDFLGEITDFPTSGSGLALVVQTDGSMWMLIIDALHDALDCFVRLFKFDFSVHPPAYQEYGTTKNMSFTQSGVITLLEEYAAIPGPQPELQAAIIALLATKGVDYLNTSFRYGKGLQVNSPHQLTIFATDRNTFPLADIPLVGSQRNFSLVGFIADG